MNPFGRSAALVAVLCLLLGGLLVGCGGSGPTPTLAPYAGARTSGYPTPGEIRVVSNDDKGLYLVAKGDKATIPDTYATAWRADGWAVQRRDPSGDTVSITFTRAGDTRIVLFTPYDDGIDRGMMVYLRTR